MMNNANESFEHHTSFTHSQVAHSHGAISPLPGDRPGTARSILSEQSGISALLPTPLGIAEGSTYFQQKNVESEIVAHGWQRVSPIFLAWAAGVDNKDTTDVRREKKILLTFVVPVIICLTCWFMWTISNWKSGVWPSTADPWIILVAVALLLLGVAWYIKQKDHRPLRLCAVILATSYPLSVWFSFGCVSNPFPSHLWGFCASIGLLLAGGRGQSAVLWVGVNVFLSILTTVVSWSSWDPCPPEWAYDFSGQRRVETLLLQLVTDIVPLLLLFLAVKEFMSRVETERTLGDRLMRNILPIPVANVLQEQVRSEIMWPGLSHFEVVSPEAANLVIADSYPDVSVLFADLVGFTKYSHKRTPQEIVRRLNAIVQVIDQMCLGAGVEKIKTIGDCYMCACIPALACAQTCEMPGFGDKQSCPVSPMNSFDLKAGSHNHLKPPRASSPRKFSAVGPGILPQVTSTAASLGQGGGALRIMAVACKLCEISGSAITSNLQFRVGCHSGPVVAGVIGCTKFIYDMWGDTVNQAARLESSGLPGKVHLSAAMKGFVGEYYDLTLRGTVSLKGIGNVTTYTYDPALDSHKNMEFLSKSLPISGFSFLRKTPLRMKLTKESSVKVVKTQPEEGQKLWKRGPNSLSTGSFPGMPVRDESQSPTFSDNNPSPRHLGPRLPQPPNPLDLNPRAKEDTEGWRKAINAIADEPQESGLPSQDSEFLDQLLLPSQNRASSPDTSEDALTSPDTRNVKNQPGGNSEHAKQVSQSASGLAVVPLHPDGLRLPDPAPPLPSPLEPPTLIRSGESSGLTDCAVEDV